MEIVDLFYVSWHLLIAQAINFAIVLFVLWRFAYKPILKIMNERTSTIEKGLEDAKKAEENLIRAKEEEESIIKGARSKGQEIIESADRDADSVKKEKIEQTRQESEKIITDAKSQIRAEREKMLAELRSELGELVMLATDKITGDKISGEVNEKLINDVLEDLQSKKIEKAW